ncbi:MAG: hypothetical protein LBC85_07350 [Fibromonadaceae bacterium]|jgi:hypothetical protein|nr:hypothetical protein [Fibromonadaceae bacterium]
MWVYLVVVALFVGCAVEDPSVEGFDLHRIRFKDRAPFEAYFGNSESDVHADRMVNLFYAMSNGDTMKVSVYEFDNPIFAKAFFYNSDSIVEKAEFLLDGERKRLLSWGRRLFVFSYMFSISENSSTLDSMMFFTRRFPAGSARASRDFQSFSLKNSDADEDISVQRGHFLGIEIPFTMLLRRYRDSDFSWSCARSYGKVSDSDWENFLAERQKNFYEADSTALVSRLSNGVVVAVYGDLDRERMKKVFREFTALVR